MLFPLAPLRCGACLLPFDLCYCDTITIERIEESEAIPVAVCSELSDAFAEWGVKEGGSHAG